MYYALCIATFCTTYVICLTYTSVFYHRGLTHDALRMRPWVRRWAARTGLWVTCLDPKAWVCMHRRHHAFSDTQKDPHSPGQVGLWGVLLQQKKSYEEVIEKLAQGDSEYSGIVADLDFPVSSLYQYGYAWLLPYAVHIAIGVCIAIFLHAPLLAAAYFFGITSHPFQGWAVNSLGHARGHRNFATDDESRNNHVVGWLVMGEGYQNNHHRYPASARFSLLPWELDLGYVACCIFDKLGVVKIRRESLIGRMASARSRAAAAA